MAVCGLYRCAVRTKGFNRTSSAALTSDEMWLTAFISSSRFCTHVTAFASLNQSRAVPPSAVVCRLNHKRMGIFRYAARTFGAALFGCRGCHTTVWPQAHHRQAAAGSGRCTIVFDRLLSTAGKESSALPPSSVTPSLPAAQLPAPRRNAEESPMMDLGGEVRDLLTAVMVMHERFGRHTVAQFLRGVSTPSLASKIGKCVSLPEFGCGSYRSEAFWVALADQLIADGFLKQRYYGHMPCLQLTNAGLKWLSTNIEGTLPKTMMLLPKAALMHALAISKTDPLPSISSNVAALPDAPATDVPILPRHTASSSPTSMPSSAGRTGTIMSNGASSDKEISKMVLGVLAAYCKKRIKDRVPDVRDMQALAKHRPTSQENLRRIGSLSAAKIEFLGDSVLKLMQELCSDRGLQSDVFGDDGTSSVPQQLGVDPSLHVAFNALPKTVQTSYNLVKSKAAGVEFAATQRGLQPMTITKHVLKAMASGLPVDHRDFLISDDMLRRAEQVLRSLPPTAAANSSKWRGMTEALPGFKPYQIIAALSLLRRSGAGITVPQQGGSDASVRALYFYGPDGPTH